MHNMRSVFLLAIVFTTTIAMVTVDAAPANSAAGFFDVSGFDPAIPAPETVIDLPVGLNPARPGPLHDYSQQIREKAVSHGVLLSYLHRLADASDRLTLNPCGRSHEGRTLFYLTVTSPANHKRLKEIKALNAKLADPRKMTDKDNAKKIIRDLPAVAWLGYSIHGDELCSTDAAMYMAYRFAAATDKETLSMLDEMVIHIAPLVNPDGRERYLGQLHEFSGIVENSDFQAMQHSGEWSRGRGNHYLFDLNRDWLVFAHPETASLAKVINEWHPHLLVDMHEMGGMDTHLFDPPNEPINAYRPAENMPWRKRFSVDLAAAFNRHGWSYYTREWYSDWGPFYTNSWASQRGAIGILHEQARVNGSEVKLPTGAVRTYRQSVHNQIVGSLTNLKSLQDNREEILSDFYADKKWCISPDAEAYEALILPPCKDETRRAKFINVLLNHGIEVHLATEAFKAGDLVGIWVDNHDELEFAAGTAVVKTAQPLRHLINAMLDFDPRFKDSFLKFERQEVEKYHGSHFYDVSSYSLAIGFGLEAYWAKSASKVKLMPYETAPNQTKDKLRASAYGYVIDLADSKVYPALAVLLQNGCNPRIATKPFKLGREYAAGAVIIRSHENPDNVLDILQQIHDDYAVEIVPIDTALVEDGPDLGGQKVLLLREPKVALAAQWPVSTYSFGSIWHLLDHDVHLRISPVNIQNMGRIDLRKYNVLILPDSRNLSAVLNESAVKKIRQWVESGGTLIALGKSVAFAADKDKELSSVRLKRDVLEELPVYAEAIQRERDARNVDLSTIAIWSDTPETQKEETSEEDTSAKEEKKEKEDADALKRLDEWQRMFSTKGAFVAADLDPEHWLAFGCGEKMPVMFSGDYALMSKHPVATPVRLAAKEQLRLSGLLWPEARERIENTAYITVEKLGHGQVILFACDPTLRRWLPASERLLLNAVLLGPGVGTTPPIPW